MVRLPLALLAAGMLLPACGGSERSDARSGGGGGGGGEGGERTITELALALEAASLPLGSGEDLRALLRFSDGTEEDATGEATWSSSDPAVVSIEATAGQPAKLITVAEGTATITVTAREMTASTAITVRAPELASILVAPTDPQMRPGESVQLTAIGTYTDGKKRDVSGDAIWSSQRPSVVSIDANGLATALGLGQSNLKATVGEITGQVTAKVECAYPGESAGILYGDVMPALSWQGAYFEDGTQADFSLYNFHCASDYDQYRTITFVVGAGWCPNCPGYARRLADMQPRLAAAGMLLVFVEAETSSRRPATNADARNTVNRWIGTAAGVRVGDADTMPLRTPFLRAASGFPSAYIVRRSDMMVIADQARSRYVLDFEAIARNPDRLY